jgi:hypothetical protein
VSRMSISLLAATVKCPFEVIGVATNATTIGRRGGGDNLGSWAGDCWLPCG